MKIKVNFNGLLDELEQKSGRHFSNRYIAKSSGVRRATIIDLRRENLKRISLESLEKLGRFFIAHGLLIEPGDLLMNAD